MRYPISNEELAQRKALLSRWQSPAEFVRRVDDLMGKLKSDAWGPVQFFNDPHLKFAGEAWVAAKLATMLAADEVRLVPDTWPDCELRQGEQVQRYEVSKADVEGRRRGDEYRAAATSEQDLEFDDWAARVAQAPGALRRAAETKAGKGYPKTAGLVIYLNLSEYGWKRKEIEALIHEVTSAAKDAFCDVWVLWDGRLYRVWDHGERAEQVFT